MPLIWYSTGSSTVMIFLSGVLIWPRQAYSVVVLPEPVGPVTSTTPSERWMRRSNLFWSSERKPSCGRPSARFDLSRIRMTIDSPWFVGTVETRRSRSRPPTLIWMRPSCGMRFSEILIFDMILKREIIAPCRRFGGESILRSAPSMR